MHYLVKFDNDEYCIATRKKVKILTGKSCSVKLKGSSYLGYIITCSDSVTQLERELEDLLSSKEAELSDASQKCNGNLKETLLMKGTGCSTPISNKIPRLSEIQIRLSAIDIDKTRSLSLSNQSTESSVPSGATELMSFVGNDWLRSEDSHKISMNGDISNHSDTSINKQTSNASKSCDKDLKIYGNELQIGRVNKIIKDVVKSPVIYTSYITENFNESSIVEETNVEKSSDIEERNVDQSSVTEKIITEEPSISEEKVADKPSLTEGTNIQEPCSPQARDMDEPSVLEMSNEMSQLQDERHFEKLQEQQKNVEMSSVTEKTHDDVSTAADHTNGISQSDYEPTITTEESTHNNTDGEPSTSKATKKQSLPVPQGPAIDHRQLNVPNSKKSGNVKSKQYFCPYCKTIQTQFARHLKKHEKSEPEVKKILSLDNLNPQRKKLIAAIRNRGSLMHNTNAELNTGILITARRPQAKYERKADDYVPCSKCGNTYSKNTLRIHYIKCNPDHKKGTRGQKIEGRRLFGHIHSKANDEFRLNIWPRFNDDEIRKAIQYDRVLILFGNSLCEKYPSNFHEDMIRNRLRLVSRFKLAIKEINNDVTDLASIFHPRYYDDMLKAVRVCADYDAKKKVFETPSNGTSLGNYLKKCATVHRSDCIKESKDEQKKAVDEWLELFADEYGTRINKKVAEDQMQKRLAKKIVLPQKEDIKKLYDYLGEISENYISRLRDNFDRDAWIGLSESALILAQMFNRRRAGEIERLLIENYENQETIDKTLDATMYEKISDSSREQAQQFVRVTMRGKKGLKPVPILMHTTLVSYIDMIIKYRNTAGVSSSNKYVFAVPDTNTLRKEYLRACPLMRKFSERCGASDPKALRGTNLRKHIATYTAMLRVEEDQVLQLCKYMGHDIRIHEGTYRIPNGVRDMTEVSRLLQSAIGDDDDDENNVEETPKTTKFTRRSKSKTVINETEHQNKKIIKKRHIGDVDVDDSSSKCSRTNKKIRKRIVEVPDSSSDDNEAASSSQTIKTNKNHYRWTAAERKVVEKKFGDLTRLKVLPSASECQELISSCDVFNESRTAESLKTWIDNQRKASKRRENYHISKETKDKRN